MTITKMENFSFNHAEQQDDLYQVKTSAEIKQDFDSRGEELKEKLNSVIDQLNSTEAGESGAQNIGTESIDGLSGNDVQAVLKSAKNLIDDLQDQIDTNYTELADQDVNLSTESINRDNNHKNAVVLDHPDKSVVETKLADDSVSRRTIQTGAIGVNEIDPAILNQPTTLFGQQAKFEQIDEQLADIVYQPKQFGCIGDGVADDTVNLQNASNKALLDNAVLDLGRYTYRITSPVQFACNLDGKHATILADGISNNYAVLIGNTDNSYILDKHFYSPIIKNKVKNWVDNSVGLKISNIQSSHITISKISDFQTNLFIHAKDKGTSYNNITIKNSYNGFVNLLLQTEGTGWVNENNFFVGRLGHDSLSGTNVVGCRHIKMYSAVNTINNNIFYKPCFEGNTKEYDLEMVNSSYNQFVNPRWESSTPKALFDQISSILNSSYNVFLYGYKSETVAVTENGSCDNNTFYRNRNGLLVPNNLKMKNSSSNGTATFEVYDAADKLNNVAANDYLVSVAGNFIKVKRKTDTYPRIFIDIVNGKIKFGNGAVDPVVSIDAYGSGSLKLSGGSLFQDGTWNGSHFVIGTRHEWYDASGNKRAKNSVPTSDTDGVIISINPVP